MQRIITARQPAKRTRITGRAHSAISSRTAHRPRGRGTPREEPDRALTMEPEEPDRALTMEPAAAAAVARALTREPDRALTSEPATALTQSRTQHQLRHRR